MKHAIIPGDYELKYEWSPPLYYWMMGKYIGSKTVSFKVAGENIARITDNGIQKTDNGFDVGVVNLGSNEFKGELNFQTPFYQTNTAVSLGVGKAATFTFNLARGTQAALIAGTYTANAAILYDGNELDKRMVGFRLEPCFKVSGISCFELVAGRESTITVGIKNIGNAVGEARVKVKLLDLVDEEKGIWLEPQGVGSLSFRLQVPGDFEDGTYSLVVMMVGQASLEVAPLAPVTTLVKIRGIRLNVVAGLDKEAYADGEMATLTLTVTNLSNASLGTLNLFARVKFNDYKGIASFLLPYDSCGPITFNLPIHLPEVLPHSGQKLNFGIYSTDDRAIWLDAVYVRDKGTLTITADKQMYEQGGTVTLTLALQEQGTVSLSTPGEPRAGTLVFNEPGSQTFAFRLPAQMLTGSYDVSCSLPSDSHFLIPIDVRGIAAVVKEMRLDKEGYNVNDRFSLSVRMDVNEKFEGRLKGWIVHDGTWTKVCDEPKTFVQGIGNYEIIGTTTEKFGGV